MKRTSYMDSLTDLLIATLASGRSVCRFRDILKEREFERFKESSIHTTLSRLNKKGYASSTPKGWSITKSGHAYLLNKREFSYISSPFHKQRSSKMILSFDIPEKDRKIRNWLRNQIKIFGYEMLQQSLWIGPGPLPPAFLKRLEDLKIRKNVKTFKVQKN